MKHLKTNFLSDLDELFSTAINTEDLARLIHVEVLKKIIEYTTSI